MGSSEEDEKEGSLIAASRAIPPSCELRIYRSPSQSQPTFLPLHTLAVRHLDHERHIHD